jgi:hypothetical protein
MKDFKTKNGFFTGNVGIGTTNPGAKLNIANTTADSNTFTISRAENAAISLFSIFQDSSWDIGGGQGSGIAHVNTNNRNLAITTSSDQSLDGGIFINESGNVGIGATNPTDKLYIKAGLNDLGATIENTSGNPARLTLTNSEGSGYVDCNNNLLRLSNNTSSDLVINSAGNVGIGTTSPNALLDVTGSLDLLNSAILQNTSSTGYGLITKGGGNGKSRYIADFRDKDNSSALKIDGDGNVGIGTTNPGVALEVNGPAGSQFRISRDLAPSTQYSQISGGGSSMAFLSASNTHSAFHFISDNGTDELERMRIDSNGKVGIGTTNPVANLHVVDSVFGGVTALELKNNNGNSNIVSSVDMNMIAGGLTGKVILRTINSSATATTDGELAIHTTSSGTTSEAMRIDSNGNVGIGTASPAQKLDIYGKFTVNHDGVISWGPSGMGRQFWDSGKVIIRGESGTALHLGANGLNDHLIVNTNGNVGIGTTNPGSYKLNINGTARVASGDVTSDDRVKHNEQPIVGALGTLSKITPKKYIKTVEMYDANHDFELDADGNPIDENGEPVEHRVEAGVIAQQILTVNELAFAVSPEGVDEDGNTTSPHGLDYNSLFTYAIAAIQEQQTIIEDLKARIETLES